MTNPDAFQALTPSTRLPVLFLGHGSPMNAIEDNEYRRSWQALGAKFGPIWPKPQLILCISAHWLTSGWALTAMAQPQTIHDFGGFPQALFDQQYPAPGFPSAALEISKALKQAEVGTPLVLDQGSWGFDHGTWSVLKPMFPAADIPVIQLSMDPRGRPEDHFAVGQQLKALRERGVLILGSGNFVHNLRTMQPGAASTQAYEWAIEFDQTIASYLKAGDFGALQRFKNLKTAALAHPSDEHFLPLLYTAGAVDAHEVPEFFNTSYQAASIAMRSVVWGG
jgi:4,5-DOPA dioxygenase extradiol